MITKPSKEKQIEPILKGTSCELFEECVPQEEWPKYSYKDIFQITKAEIKEYIEKRYRLDDLVPSVRREGVFALKENDGHRLYYMEYGRAMDQGYAKNDEELFVLFIDFLTRTSGTGLKFE